MVQSAHFLVDLYEGGDSDRDYITTVWEIDEAQWASVQAAYKHLERNEGNAVAINLLVEIVNLKMKIISTEAANKARTFPLGFPYGDESFDTMVFLPMPDLVAIREGHEYLSPYKAGFRIWRHGAAYPMVEVKNGETYEALDGFNIDSRLEDLFG